MIRGYLCYERQDAVINAMFIEQLQRAASAQQIELTLVYPDEIEQLPSDIAFVWNRSRQKEVARYFETLGIRVFNNSRTNEIANDKLLAQQFVAQLGILTIPSTTDLDAIKHYPVVVKSVDGHGGKEVFYCENQQQLVHNMKQLQHENIVIQPFIESNAQDVRVWVLGEKIIGAVLRTGTTDFKSNYTLGGTIVKATLPPTVEQAVLTIAQTLRSDYIGIDFIKGVDGHYYFNEIEDPVGAKSYYDLYNHQLPELLITYIRDCLR